MKNEWNVTLFFFSRTCDSIGHYIRQKLLFLTIKTEWRSNQLLYYPIHLYATDAVKYTAFFNSSLLSRSTIQQIFLFDFFCKILLISKMKKNFL